MIHTIPFNKRRIFSLTLFIEKFFNVVGMGFQIKEAHKKYFDVDNENMIETFALQSYYFYLIQL